MSVQALSGVDSTSLIRQLLASLQAGRADNARQKGTDETAGSAKAADAPDGPPPAKRDGSASDRFSADTLASLLGVQQRPQASDIASKLLSQVDTNNSGGLSLDEITKALGPSSDSSSSSSSSTSSKLAEAFTSLDANGDGQLDSSELTAGIQAQFKAHGGHHRHHQAYAQAAAATAATPASTPAASTDPTTTTTTASVDVAA